MQENIKRRLLLIAGIIFTSIGTVGIFIPILPTTPFLLLAAICFVRSSQKLYNWLLNNKLFGAYLKNYLEGKGMLLKIKVLTIILLWVAIILSIAFTVNSTAIQILLAAIAVGVTVHILTIRTTGKNSQKGKKEAES